MDKNKLAEMHKSEEYNQAGFATFVLIVFQIVSVLLFFGAYKLVVRLIEIGG